MKKKERFPIETEMIIVGDELFREEGYLVTYGKSSNAITIFIHDLKKKIIKSLTPKELELIKKALTYPEVKVESEDIKLVNKKEKIK